MPRRRVMTLGESSKQKYRKICFHQWKEMPNLSTPFVVYLSNFSFYTTNKIVIPLKSKSIQLFLLFYKNWIIRFFWSHNVPPNPLWNVSAFMFRRQMFDDGRLISIPFFFFLNNIPNNNNNGRYAEQGRVRTGRAALLDIFLAKAEVIISWK